MNLIHVPALLVTVTLAIACASSPETKATATPQPPVPDVPDVTALQARVESGLVQAIRIRGEETPTKLADRMKELHIPGVSIAVLDDYRIVWAEAYGLADASTAQAVSESTPHRGHHRARLSRRGRRAGAIERELERLRTK